MKRFFLIILPICFLICLFLLPWIFSSPIGKPLFLHILKSHFNSDIQIKQVHLSWLGPQEFEDITFSNDKLDGSIQKLTSTVPFWNLSNLKSSFQLENGRFSIPQDKEKTLEQVYMAVEGNAVKASGSTTKGGSLAVQGVVQSQDHFDITAQVKDLPTAIVDHLLKFNDHLTSLLGDSLTFSGSFTYQNRVGSLTARLSSSNMEGSINGLLQNQILTLKEPLIVSIQLTSELSRYLIKQMGLSITSLAAKNPILLKVFPQNTKIPLSPFSLKKLQIGDASLDLGKLEIESEKILFSLNKLFKNVAVSTQVPFWFTPFSFQMENGHAKIGRLDVLISNSIHLCTWGDIDLIDDSLNMTLGLPADTLTQVFNLQNLSHNFVLKIPVKGSISNPELDAGPALAKITTMSATQQLPGKTGKIFGGIVSKITQKNEKEDVPPPNRPFPWEK